MQQHVLTYPSIYIHLYIYDRRFYVELRGRETALEV